VPVITAGDAITTQQWDTDAGIYTRYLYGAVVEQRPFTDAEIAWLTGTATDSARQANRAALLAAARIAVANNAAYLAKVTAGTAVTADHIAQVPALTRQMQAVIRIIVGSDLLDQTGG
jgi:hypothetical protein